MIIQLRKMYGQNNISFRHKFLILLDHFYIFNNIVLNILIIESNILIFFLFDNIKNPAILSFIIISSYIIIKSCLNVLRCCYALSMNQILDLENLERFSSLIHMINSYFCPFFS